MSITTLTVKGQVTIPKPVRDALHLMAGSKVEFIMGANNEVTLRPVTKRVDEVFGRLSQYGKQEPVSVEEMNAAVKANMKDRCHEGS
ncbi:AbrB family transcriptional regulator [bacterium endosymbiont of Escarpia laminata]|nr:MAG: AbrB family transcriptional regulator [bacterium endosymbiont of Escarpia laminata]